MTSIARSSSGSPSPDIDDTADGSRRRIAASPPSPAWNAPESIVDDRAHRRALQARQPGRPARSVSMLARHRSLPPGQPVPEARLCPSAGSERRRVRAAPRCDRASFPARRVTIARSSPAIALIRLDLPALGGPATTTRTPSFRRSAGGLESHDSQLFGQNAAIAQEPTDRGTHRLRHNRSRAQPQQIVRAIVPASQRPAS